VNDICMDIIVSKFQGCDYRISISILNIDTIDDTFEVSIWISTILSCRSIESGIDDTFAAGFFDTSISILLN
jgi:hypothetical protein